jgi:hypothetical protein
MLSGSPWSVSSTSLQIHVRILRHNWSFCCPVGRPNVWANRHRQHSVATCGWWCRHHSGRTVRIHTSRPPHIRCLKLHAIFLLGSQLPQYVFLSSRVFFTHDLCPLHRVRYDRCMAVHRGLRSIRTAIGPRVQEPGKIGSQLRSLDKTLSSYD